MNFFVYHINDKGEKQLTTCPMDGSALPGITRGSIIELAKEWGMKVAEEYMTINELIDLIQAGKVLDAFGSGTACVVCPISHITHKGEVK